MIYEFAYLWALGRAGVPARSASWTYLERPGFAWGIALVGILHVTSSHSFHLEVSPRRCSQKCKTYPALPAHCHSLNPVPASGTNIVIGHVKTRQRTLASTITVVMPH